MGASSSVYTWAVIWRTPPSADELQATGFRSRTIADGRGSTRDSASRAPLPRWLPMCAYSSVTSVSRAGAGAGQGALACALIRGVGQDFAQRGPAEHPGIDVFGACDAELDDRRAWVGHGRADRVVELACLGHPPGRYAVRLGQLDVVGTAGQIDLHDV